MGLRCSLLGHDFGDVVVEHDRDERGEEVVVTEREIRECRRCGTESVVSENTEVRRRRPEEDHGTDTGAEAPGGKGANSTDADPESSVDEAETSAAAREQADGDAIILDDETETTTVEDDRVDAPENAESAETPHEPTSPAESATTDEQTTPEASQTTAEPDDRPATPEEPADERTPEKAPAQDTPETSAETASEAPEAEQTEWPDESSSEDPSPDADRTDEPWPNQSDAEAEADDAPRESRPPDEQSTGARSPGSGFEFAESGSGSSDQEQAPSEPSSGIARKGSIDLTGPPDGSVDGVLVCPACGFTVPIARSSNRPGDICPECHAGYLAEDT